MTTKKLIFKESYEIFGECWLWKRSKFPTGYGQWKRDDLQEQYAHRISYIIHKGKIKMNNVVMHSCDNKACVNPEHLFQGTQIENIRDCVKKGRNSKGKRHSEIQKLHRKPLITGKNINYIFNLIERGFTQLEIAKEFNVSISCIEATLKRARGSK